MDVHIFHVEQATPVISDRDVVLKSEIIIDSIGQKVISRFYKIDYPLPPREGIVRMNSMQGSYIFEWAGRELTKLTFIIDCDINSSIPAWSVNPEIEKSAYSYIQAIKKVAKQKKYIERGKKSKYKVEIEKALKDELIK